VTDGTPDLVVTVAVSPAPLPADEAPMVTGTTRNRGNQPVPLELHTSRLELDGEAVAAWPLAIGNGLVDPRTLSLPPGEEVTFRRGLGAGALGSPGTHTVSLVVRGTPSGPVTLEVLDA
jgi:hypothetical protein